MVSFWLGIEFAAAAGFATALTVIGCYLMYRTITDYFGTRKIKRVRAKN